MRILFVTGRAHLPQSFGGVQSSTETTILSLQSAGHQCAVACALWTGGAFAFERRVRLKLSRKPFVTDTGRGYPVYRSWTPVDTIGRVAEDFRPDVAVVQHSQTVPFTKALSAAGVPVAVYFRNLEFEELSGDLRELPPGVRYIANSRFTAAAYTERYGIDAVVLPPLIDARRYRTETRGSAVTMINPVPQKGIDVTLEIARLCPDIPFNIVEGWGLPDETRRRIDAINAVTGNITVQPRTEDMRSVYANTRVLLAPSQWQEAWGRVASEAHVSGIPVIGSDRGGLPEAIGPGGIVVPHDAPAEHWAKALRDIWDDEGSWTRLSNAAVAYSLREEMQLDGHVRTLLATLEAARGC